MVQSAGLSFKTKTWWPTYSVKTCVSAELIPFLTTWLYVSYQFHQWPIRGHLSRVTTCVPDQHTPVPRKVVSNICDTGTNICNHLGLFYNPLKTNRPYGLITMSRTVVNEVAAWNRWTYVHVSRIQKTSCTLHIVHTQHIQQQVACRGHIHCCS